MSYKKRGVHIEIDPQMMIGPRGLSISLVKFKETLANGNNVYNIFIENGQKVGEFIANKGDDGKKGGKGEPGRGIVEIVKLDKIDKTNNWEIKYTDRTSSFFSVEDGKDSYEIWLHLGNKGTVEDFFEAYRGYSLDFIWQGTKLGIKKTNEDTYTFVDLLGKTGPNGKNLEFQWNETSLGIRVEGEENYQFVDLRGERGKNLEFQWRGTELGVRIEGDTEYQYVNLVGQSTDYNLPIATKTTLGGIKIGANMQITSEGVLNPKYPIASKSGKGIVQIGDGIDVNNGVISAKTLLEYNKPTGSMLFNGESEYFNKNSLEFLGNTAIGDGALCTISIQEATDAPTICSTNTAIGFMALNTAFGDFIGSGNTAIGSYALENPNSNFQQAFSYNTAIGYGAGQNMLIHQNTTCIGFESNVTGSHQVQLGNRYTNVYCYGTIQDRSDKRDKTDIKDTSLGLEFLMKLRPREYRWDYRESYINTEEIRKISNKIKKLNKKGRKIDIKSALERFSIENIKKDGSQKGWRFHQGFIAQEVFQVMRELGVDFGGYQDHSINGGKDVLSIGYNEFIPVLVKGIQEQQKQIQELSNEIKKIKAELNKEKV